MTSLTQLTLSDAADGLKAKTFSSKEITQAFLTEIDKSNPHLNAYVVVTHDKALKMADKADANLKAGKGGKLEGAPLGIKDLFCTEGVRTTACSNILGEFTPPYESTVTQNLWDQGAVMLGKLNMDEFAMGSDNGTSRFGPPTNPWPPQGLERASSPPAAPPAARRRRCRPICASPRRHPTPADRSASQQRSPASSASSRPMGAPAVTAWSRSPLRWIRPALSPRR
jgi:Asp-tRNA(Asn)/Glu-tRNA(Gln) amidotransferase A subunit family amidase